MTREFATGRVSDAEWVAEHVRCTLFYRLADSPNLSGLWEQVTEESPESVTSKPKTHEHAESGPWGQGQLTLHGQKGRIDWRYGPSEELDAPLPSFPDRVTRFLNLMNRWFRSGHLPPVVRLAFGSLALLPVPDVAAGYRTLCDYLPFDIDRSVSSDFLYQINRPRPSGVVEDLTVNRLTKWSVAVSARMTMLLTDRGVVPLSEDGPRQAHYCHLETDINTALKVDRVIAHEKVEPAFLELVTMGREIIREGDIP